MKSTLFETKPTRGFGWLIDKLCARRTSSKRVKYCENRGHPMALFANDHIGISINQFGVYESEELNILFDFLKPINHKLCKGCALDIGANIGNHSLYFSNVFSRVVGFEPNPHTFELLKYNASFRQNIDVHCVGLGDKVGTFNIIESPGNLGASYISKKLESNTSAVSVSIDTLDAIVGDVDKIGFIKIDVEGFEEAVIRGGTTTITTHQPVIVFEQLENEFKNESSPTIDSIRNLGYRFCWLEYSPSPSFWLSRVLVIIFGLFFCCQKAKIKTGDKIPVKTHSMLIAIPKRFWELLGLTTRV